MPKIRGVKPDYWTDEDIVELSISARLLFIGLWNYACDNGHLEDKPKQIKARILPEDDVNVAELLRELHKKERILRSDGWITVPHLAEHQKPDKRYWLTCKKPGCVAPDGDSQRKSRSAHGGHTAGTPSAHGVDTSGAHVDGDGDGDGDGELMVMVNSAPKRAHQLRDDFEPNDTNRRIAADEHVDLDRELEQFKDFHLSKGSKFADWNRALNTWLRNARKYGGPHLAPVPDPGVVKDAAYYRNLPYSKPQIP